MGLIIWLRVCVISIHTIPAVQSRVAPFEANLADGIPIWVEGMLLFLRSRPRARSRSGKKRSGKVIGPRTQIWVTRIRMTRIGPSPLRAKTTRSPSLSLIVTLSLIVITLPLIVALALIALAWIRIVSSRRLKREKRTTSAILSVEEVFMTKEHALQICHG